MLGTVIRLGIVAIFCIVVYNYFFGTSSEKANSAKIFHGVGVLFGDVKDLVSTEKDKFDAGKYNSALDKMSNVIDQLKDHANATSDPAMQNQVHALEQKKDQLKNRVQTDESSGYGANGGKQATDKSKEAADLTHQLETLINETQNLVHKVSPSDN